jgi:hypothetical protein
MEQVSLVTGPQRLQVFTAIPCGILPHQVELRDHGTVPGTDVPIADGGIDKTHVIVIATVNAAIRMER